MTVNLQRKIIRDSLWLYARMGILTILNLWTVRLLVEAMGVDGYGMWSLILSIVLLWSFLGDIVGEAIMRYVSVALARDNEGSQLQSIIKVYAKLYIMADIVMVLLSSTVGYLWLIHEADISPDCRSEVLQTFFVVIAMLAIKVLNVPFLSYIVAKERFKKYVILSLAEGVATFGTAYLLTFLPRSESLISYAWMLVAVEACILPVSMMSCRSDLSLPASWRLNADDMHLMHESVKYILWLIIGGGAVIVWIQGMNIVVNSLYGIEATAACAISMGLLVRLRGLCANVQRAVQPRLMKDYSASRKSELTSLLRNHLGISTLLIAIFCIPAYIYTPRLLELWLTDVPPLTVPMTRIVILSAFIIILEVPLNAVIHASGNIKKFEIIEGGILLLIIPVFWLTAVTPGTTAVTAFGSQLVVIAAAAVVRAVMAHKCIERLKV